MRLPLLPAFVLVVTCVVVSCNKSDTPTNNNVVSITDLLPRDNEISGWARASRAWVARNKEDLQREIDGGFEIFANHGFVEGAMQNFTGSVNQQSGIECDIEVYDQHSALEADALFDDPEKAFSSPITPNNTPSARAQIQKDVFSYRMKFSKSKYFVTISIGSSDDKTQEVIEIFANNIAGKIK